jgi:hypothetical protein
LHVGLSAEFSFRSDFTSDAGDFRRERAELIDHRVDGVLQLEDLAAYFDSDLLRQVAVCDRGGDFGDVANLVGEIRGHRVDRVRQVLPRTGDAFDIRLSAEFSFRSHFASDARDFRGERRELRDHRVDCLRGAQELALERTALELDGHAARQIAFRDGADHAGDLVRRLNEIGDQRIDGVGDHCPRSALRRELRTLIELAFFSNDFGDALHFTAHALLHLNDFIERVGDLSGGAGEFDRHPGRKIALLHRSESS